MLCHIILSICLCNMPSTGVFGRHHVARLNWLNNRMQPGGVVFCIAQGLAECNVPIQRIAHLHHCAHIRACETSKTRERVPYDFVFRSGTIKPKRHS